jgi:hypothetical protein
MRTFKSFRKNFNYVFVLSLVLSGLFTYLMPGSASAATFTVTNANNSGAGSLRQAIIDANATSAADIINFSIGSGAVTIAPTSQLPTLTRPVTIDGTSQPGFGSAPIVEISGQNAGANAIGIYASVNASGSTIKGLVINRFNSSGIFIDRTTTNISIVGNYIGTNAAGTAPAANGGEGIGILNASNNTIGGTTSAARNVISGNALHGIAVTQDSFGGNATNNTISGNYIGTSASGFSAVPNTFDAILINDSPNNTIGGTTGTTPGGPCTGACNLISGGKGNGVGLWHSGSFGNSVLGNFIGVNLNGDVGMSNGNIGVEVNETRNNTVGGTTAAARNILSGNLGAGVFITGQSSTANIVEGNYIGTNAAGTGAIPNAKMGVSIGPSPVTAGTINNVIGGTTGTTPGGACTGACNLISGNAQTGILISNIDSGGQQILGNYIGTNAAGTGAVPNGGDGIGFLGSPNHVIGGSSPNARNVIAGNMDNGIIFAQPNSTGIHVEGNFIGEASNGAPLGNLGAGIMVADGHDNALIGNSIYANGKYGIDLGYNNLTANDLGDGDGGANRGQNFPDLYAVHTSGPTTTISGSLNSWANVDYRIDFFASSTCNGNQPNNYGEGQHFLGSKDITTDPWGNRAFSYSPSSAVGSGMFITATATRKVGATPAETSEFSRCIPANTAKPALNSGSSWYLKNDLSTGPADISFGYGFPATTLMCAWDPGQPGVKLPVLWLNGHWLMRSSYTTGPATISFDYGFPAIPVCGDWNGDGIDTPGLYANGTWLLRNTNNTGVADITFSYGGPGYDAVVGDWDGDGTDTIGVAAVNSQLGQYSWGLRNSNTAGAPDFNFTFGPISSRPVIGDWDGNGTATIGIFDQRNAVWALRNTNGGGAPDQTFTFGFPGVRPLVW